MSRWRRTEGYAVDGVAMSQHEAASVVVEVGVEWDELSHVTVAARAQWTQALGLTDGAAVMVVVQVDRVRMFVTCTAATRRRQGSRGTARLSAWVGNYPRQHITGRSVPREVG